MPMAGRCRSARSAQRCGASAHAGRWFGGDLLDSENAELFRLAVGGYGLFGIVIDADLAMVRTAC